MDVSRTRGMRVGALLAATTLFATALIVGVVPAAVGMIIGEPAVGGDDGDVGAGDRSDTGLSLPGNTATAIDRQESLRDAATEDVGALNVPPSVELTAVGVSEGGAGRIHGTVTDADAVVAVDVDWGDGSATSAVTAAQLAAGLEHVYGDDGAYPVTVTVTDEDGGVGAHAVALEVLGADPEVALDLGDPVPFPGGDYIVVTAGATRVAASQASDAGSDDLAFSWSTGESATFANDRVAPDPPQSPFGAFPFAAAAAIEVEFADEGVETVRVVVTDDDGAVRDASAAVIVTGVADAAYGPAWWTHEFAGAQGSLVPPATAAAYLDVVAAASRVFSEREPVATPAQALAVLAGGQDGERAAARSELLCAWLHLASGAIAWDATVTPSSGAQVGYLDLMADAEEAIADPSTDDEELRAVREDLSRLRGAGD